MLACICGLKLESLVQNQEVVFKLTSGLLVFKHPVRTQLIWLSTVCGDVLLLYYFIVFTTGHFVPQREFWGGFVSLLPVENKAIQISLGHLQKWVVFIFLEFVSNHYAAFPSSQNLTLTQSDTRKNKSFEQLIRTRPLKMTDSLIQRYKCNSTYCCADCDPNKLIFSSTGTERINVKYHPYCRCFFVSLPKKESAFYF